MIHFDRNKLLSEDLPTSALALSTLTGSDIISADEARAYLMGRPFDLSGPAPKPKPPPPPAPVPPVAPGPAADPEEDPEEENP